MKLLRVVSLLMVLAVPLLIAPGAAGSTATPTSPADNAYTGKVHASSEGHVVIHNPFAEIQCNSTLEGEIESHGFGKAISMPLTSLSFTGCTGDWTSTVTLPGNIAIHSIAGSKNGTVTWSEAAITFTNDAYNFVCRYITNNTDVGTLTGSKTTGATATIDLGGHLPIDSSRSSIFCGTAATTVTGSYKVASPDYLDVDDASIPGSTATSPAGTPYTGKVHAPGEDHATIHSPVGQINCGSTIEGEVKAGASGELISIPLSTLTFTGCTEGWHVTVVSAGTLKIHLIANSTNGTVTWSGATFQATVGGITCNYKTNNTDVGTLTGSKTTGATATIDLGGKLPIHSGSSIFCGTAGTAITGSYNVTTPDYLDIDVAS